MTAAQQKAMRRVVHADRLYQSEVPAGERQVYLDLMALGMIVELHGSWSGKAYWSPTAKGMKYGRQR